MQIRISRSEKKRQANRVEELAHELAGLSPNEISNLPADDFLKKEILAARSMKGGARKRQTKHIAGELRRRDTSELTSYLATRKGSHLQEQADFHELEILRQAIITDVIACQEEARGLDLPLPQEWESPALEKALEQLPELSAAAVRNAAHRYARNRKIAHSREIFRLLKAAQARQRYHELQAKMQEPENQPE
ncbi:ribosome biogenesis factor YjgA [Desulfurivibrio sp. D14AmB]|uniref:ribosome biogenesis factor YjgA n=1 Tax=Desulfurivibrio sp. D14AmB TaxID=3374370 RepID=UPI00376EBA0C